MIFPIWWFFIYPFLWIIALPANFIIDSLALLLIAYCWNLKNIKKLYKSSILKVWGFWFLADIIGAWFLFLGVNLDDFLWLSYKITNAIAYNPRENWFALIWTIIALLISWWAIYWLNYIWNFSNLQLAPNQRRYLALRLAIFTAPYLFLIPLHWLFKY